MRGKVLVIDGQGGGIGKKIVASIKSLNPDCPLLAAGTNAQATSAMIKAGADAGATGESAICYQCGRADIIVGVSGILHANAMMGEISPRIAAAVSESEALKVLLPLERCGLLIAGVEPLTLDELVQKAAQLVVDSITES